MLALHMRLVTNTVTNIITNITAIALLQVAATVDMEVADKALCQALKVG